MRQVIIRWATARDAASLRPFLIACWRAAYLGILGPERIAQSIDSMFNVPGVVHMLIGSKQDARLVAELDERIVGFASAALDRKQQIILFMLYVDPQLKGRGIGTTLLGCVTGFWPEAISIRVEALADNRDGIEFYARHGFSAYGGTDDATGTPGVRSVYMDRPLTPRPLSMRERFERWRYLSFVARSRRAPVGALAIGAEPAGVAAPWAEPGVTEPAGDVATEPGKA